MPIFQFHYFVRQGDDNIIPEDLQPISRPHLFIKFTTMFHHHIRPDQDEPLRSLHTLELLVPCDEVSGDHTSTWVDIINFLNHFHVPLRIYAEEILADEANSGRMVLPMEVNLYFTEVPQLAMVVVQEEGMICCICLEEMVANSMACRLPCLHFYHDRCIIVSLTYNPSCPICRFRLD